MTEKTNLKDLQQSDDFIRRHLGPRENEIQEMLGELGLTSLDDLVEKAVPHKIQVKEPIAIEASRSEQETLRYLQSLADENIVAKSYIGMGYYDTVTPNVILRNVLENPAWYTAYTPYQPEIAQGRLEAILNFQQMTMDLTGMELGSASLLDEATAAAEAMALAKRSSKNKKCNSFFVDEKTFPQTIDVIKTRADHYGWDLIIGPVEEAVEHDVFGALLSYTNMHGDIVDIEPIIEKLHEKKAIACVASDIMSLVLLKSPGEMGADVVFGSAQRFGVPMGFGGPHAAFFGTRESYKRSLPGRIIGVSKDTRGNNALRMAMQTREQHIRREKATSNICTAQVLLANIASFYAVYHGKKGLTAIAQRINRYASIVASAVVNAGLEVVNDHWFDTVTFRASDVDSIRDRAKEALVNLRYDGELVSFSIDEAKNQDDIEQLIEVITGTEADIFALDNEAEDSIPASLVRQSDFLTHPTFKDYYSETDMLRYIKRLESKDFSLVHGMIPLGSCTMKLNATSEMLPVTWPKFATIHPFAPEDQTYGYMKMIKELEADLVEITGYDFVSMQPNSGAQGEYAGLIAIKKYHESNNDGHRNICLIPSSAHGTNPASAQMAGMKVVIVKCDDKGNVDVADLEAKAVEMKDNLAALMVTYPSTHGVYEEEIKHICDIIHDNGGQVYMDGANMNAQVGISRPGDIGSDVSHLNLHKTFAIPHGGGGPGMGPIGVKSHLAPFVSGHSVRKVHSVEARDNAVSAAPYGSGMILPISWAYIKMLGQVGLRRSTEVALLNANYLKNKLSEHYPVLYTGRNDKVAHECIIDLRQIKADTDISEVDLAKRLMDYGFHAPTMSFPVAGTFMIEPTESESKYELDRFIDAMIRIKKEIEKVASGEWEKDNNPLTNAPHTQADLRDWDKPYSIAEAIYPSEATILSKFWPTTNRIDDVFGDRNLMCSCPPTESYSE
ncbi:aminomethyl-transferring glycine dehydrogenase [Kangiella sediminilitoris]|uniref:Glycine dehydrogenase (decarboxylating) n=1 Tax=Kangiella sediminilitoris TaxID=1144748 RepID=A0A1B3B7W9_9GAMM|nr:aminomethyl-transferring glycine dehydrogenase [Kangiella sediminilitoris]AOE48890.1 glycine dehydrogenase [Kangiella sediminilitoris]